MLTNLGPYRDPCPITFGGEVIPRFYTSDKREEETGATIAASYVPVRSVLRAGPRFSFGTNSFKTRLALVNVSHA